MPDITGILKDAVRLNVGEEKALTGDIYDDAKKRFTDGRRVWTSFIKEELPGDIFVTENSVYKVESWRK